MNALQHYSNSNNSLIQATKRLLEAQAMVCSLMSLVYYFGNTSLISTVIIYGPITLLSTYAIINNYSRIYVCACLLAIAHGYCHCIYKFLNESIGVNTMVPVWQDQILHLFQAILFSVLFFDRGRLFKILTTLFVIGNICNVIVGYNCWQTSCYYIYTWMAIIPTLSSGYHFALGCLFQSSRETAIYGFVMEGGVAMVIYLLFGDGTTRIIKLFSKLRFFEIYFIGPCYIGFLNYKYSNMLKSHKPTDYFKQLTHKP